MGLTLVTPPATSPVTLLEARIQVGLAVDDTDDDTQLQGYIDAAVDDLDGPHGKLGYAIMPQTWDLTLDAFTSTIEIPLGPVTAVSSVNYFDADGVEQAVDAEYYTADLSSSRQWVVLNTDYSWPTTLDAVNAVRVRFVAGSGATAAIKLAILLFVDHHYQPIGPNNTVEQFERAYSALTGTKRKVFL